MFGSDVKVLHKFCNPCFSNVFWWFAGAVWSAEERYTCNAPGASCQWMFYKRSKRCTARSTAFLFRSHSDSVEEIVLRHYTFKVMGTLSGPRNPLVPFRHAMHYNSSRAGRRSYVGLPARRHATTPVHSARSQLSRHTHVNVLLSQRRAVELAQFFASARVLLAVLSDDGGAKVAEYSCWKSELSSYTLYPYQLFFGALLSVDSCRAEHLEEIG